jgi:hypothetical protein
MTPKILDLQRRLDEKLINPNDLTQGQRNALDEGFEKGVLKGYDSVADMVSERRIARADIAGDVRKRLEPLGKASLGALALERGVLVAAGDILGSFLPYIKDGKKLAQEAREYALAGKSPTYFPSTQNIRTESGQKTFQGMSNLIQKLPGFRNLGGFKKTAEVIDSTLDASKRFLLGNKIATQLGTTELKSQLLGATGAAAGSVAYDVVNFPFKLAAGITEDLKKYDEKERNRLPFAERTAIYALENFRDAAVFNSVAFGLFGAFQAIPKAANWSVRAYRPEQRDAIENSLKLGIPPSPIQAAKGDEIVSELYKTQNRILGIVPPFAAGATQQRKQQVGLVGSLLTEQARKTFGYPPIFNMELIAQASNQSIKKTFENNENLVNNLYQFTDKVANNVSKTPEKYADLIIQARRKEMGPQQTGMIGDANLFKSQFPEGVDLPFIPSKELTETTSFLLDQFRKGTTIEQAARRGREGILDKSGDPVVKTLQELATSLSEIKAKNKGMYLTPVEFNELRQMFNKNYVNTKFAGNDLKSINLIHNAFERDLNFIRSDISKPTVLTENPKLNNFYGAVNKTLGKDTADNFLREFKTNVNDYVDLLQNANIHFAQNVNYYASSAMAKMMRQSDSAALSAMGLLNVQGRVQQSTESAFNTLVKSVTDPDAPYTVVDDFAKFIGIKSEVAVPKGATFEKIPSKEIQQGAREMMSAIAQKEFDEAINESYISSFTGGLKGKDSAQYDPLLTYVGGPATMDEALELLSQRSDIFNRELTKKIGRESNIGIQGLKNLPEGLLYKVGKQAITPEVLRDAVARGIPITQAPYLTKEIIDKKTTEGVLRKGKFNVLFRPLAKGAEKELEPFKTNLLEAAEKQYEVQIKDKTGVLRDVTKAERLAAEKEFETVSFRTNGPQGFDVKKFRDRLGLDSPNSREKWARISAYSNNVSLAEGRENVRLLEIISNIAQDYFVKTPPPKTVSMVTRGAVFAGAGLGASAAFFPAQTILGSALGALLFKSAGVIFSNPAVAKEWYNLYRGQALLEKNSLRAMDPPMRARFADIFNYVTGDDPDAPFVDPDNIEEEKVIKYLTGSKIRTMPTDKGIYDLLPGEIKDRLDPFRQKIKSLDPATIKKINDLNKGLKVSEFRDDLIDNLDTEQGSKIANQPKIAQFIKNPMELKIPEGAKTMQADINPVTADVYAGLFPGDSIGTTIAQSQQPRPPMMKKGGFVNAKN